MEQRYERDIRIQSRIDDEVFEQTVQGVVYQKHNGWYLRYEESDDNGGTTRSIVKLAGPIWSVKRAGTIESEMFFEQGHRRNGFYRTSGIELQIVTIMGDSSLNIIAGQGSASLEYELEIGESQLQQHRITYWLD
jgi:uncharacterized beta-barrel protein YwiB (DUF1934 family)